MFFPEVEISHEEPGVFWVNAAGLSDLFSSLDHWAREIHAALTARERRASVVVGFRRFAVYAVARGRERHPGVAAPDEEEAALRAGLSVCPGNRSPLAGNPGEARHPYVGRIPATAWRRDKAPVRRRGERASTPSLPGISTIPSPRSFPVEPAACTIVPEVPEGDSVRLLFAIGQHLHPLLTMLAARREALRELEIRFLLERQEARTDRIRPADPTLDEALILDLVRLRLEGTPLPTSATEISLTAHGAPAAKEQLQLFLEAPRRDLDAANRALARIRAELGEEAVVRARLTEGHLPEARFTWEPLSHLSEARPACGRETGAGPPPLLAARLSGYARATGAGWAAYPGPRVRAGGALVGALCPLRRMAAEFGRARLLSHTSALLLPGDAARRCTLGLLRRLPTAMVPARASGMTRLLTFPLWVKSYHSFLEGASSPEELVEEAKKLGLSALALTDRDGVYGVVRAHMKAKEVGIHLIIGSQVSCGAPSNSQRLPPHPSSCLAMDRAGYANLCRLITCGRLRSPKGESRLSWQEVCAHADGLIALWGGEGSLLSGEADPTLVARLLKDAFGDRLYALIDRHRRAEEREEEARTVLRAHRYGLPLVAAPEVLYHTAARRPLQDVLTCIRHGRHPLHCRMPDQAQRGIRSPLPFRIPRPL